MVKQLRSPTGSPSGLMSSVQWDSLSQRVRGSLQAAALAISWQHQASCEIIRGLQGTLTFRMVPPGVDGQKNANAMDPDDFQRYCIEGAMAILGSMLLGMVFFCAIYMWRRRRR